MLRICEVKTKSRPARGRYELSFHLFFFHHVLSSSVSLDRHEVVFLMNGCLTTQTGHRWSSLTLTESTFCTKLDNEVSFSDTYDLRWLFQTEFFFGLPCRRCWCWQFFNTQQ